MFAYEWADNLIELPWSMQKFRPQIDLLTLNCRKKAAIVLQFQRSAIFPGEFNMYCIVAREICLFQVACEIKLKWRLKFLSSKVVGNCHIRYKAFSYLRVNWNGIEKGKCLELTFHRIASLSRRDRRCSSLLALTGLDHSFDFLLLRSSLATTKFDLLLATASNSRHLDKTERNMKLQLLIILLERSSDERSELCIRNEMNESIMDLNIRAKITQPINEQYRI